MERRERDRVNVRLQCRIGAPGQPEPVHCNVTENVSRTGMLIRWAQERWAVPAVGDRVMVKLKLPANPVFGQRWMLFQAHVVRVSMAEDESLMVAVKGSPVRFSSGRVSPIEAQPCSAYVN